MNSIHLRPYQTDCIEGIRESFRAGHRRVILCGPTGCGKTRMFSYMISEHLKKSLDHRVLVLTNRIELLTQAGGALHDMGIRPEKITADNRHINRRARSYVGMVETYWNRLKTMPDLATKMTLIIIDECHYGSFARLFAKWDELGCTALIIGCTATPISARKNDPLSNYYQALVNRVQIGDLVEQGYLSPATTFGAKLDRRGLKTDSKGDYSEQSQMDAFDKRSVYDGLIHRYQQVCEKYNTGLPLRTICFNINVEHSLRVCDEFNQAGIPARHVDGMTPPAERASILNGYKSGAFPVVCNVGILNAGFDDPQTSCIIMNRATTSPSLWLQSCGRGSRIAPGKQRFIILDMGDNWTELGLWESERDWASLWKMGRRKPETEGVAPVKACPQCMALIATGCRECPECHYVYPEKEMATAQVEEFVEVTPDMVALPKFDPEQVAALREVDRTSLWSGLDVDTIENLRELRGRSKGWPIHVIREGSSTEDEFYQKLSRLAQLRGYKSGWVYRQEFKPTLNYQTA